MKFDPIRLLGPVDASSCLAVVESLIDKYHYPFGSLWDLPKIRDELNTGVCRGAFKQDDLIAFLFLRDTPVAQEIIFLATHWQCRGQGYMKMLINKCISEKQSKELWLEVHEKNEPAVSMYEQMGFEKVGTRPKYYPDGGNAISYLYR